MLLQHVSQIESSHSLLIDSLNDKLELIGVKSGITFENDDWLFLDNRRVNHHLSFSIFDSAVLSYWGEINVTYQSQVVRLTLKEYVKLLFIHSLVGSQSVAYYKPRLNILKIMFLYMAQSTIRTIKKKHLQELYITFLTQEIVKDQLVKRISPPSYSSNFSFFSEERLIQITNRFKSAPLIQYQPFKGYAKLKNNACKAAIGKTLNDYIEGGSFNFLGLEVGKHYVDHCANIFQEFGLYASACRGVLTDIKSEPESSMRETKLTLASNLLMSVDPKVDIRAKTLNKDRFNDIVNFVKNKFTEKFNSLRPLFKLQDGDIINLTLQQLDIPERYDNQEFIRSLMFTLIEKVPVKSFDSQVDEYRSILKKTGVTFKKSNEEVRALISKGINSKKITLSDFESTCYQNQKKLNTLIPDTNIKGTDKLNYLCKFTESTGTTLFVALTGWRRSEFGFPLSSIIISKNIEPNDNAYIPYRFHVKWVTPKTAGETKLDREITLGAYLIAKQLQALNGGSIEKPCLYTGKLRVSNESAQPISRAISKAWFKFSSEYKLFKSIENKTQDKALQALSKEEIKSLKEIQANLKEDLPQFLLLNTRIGGLDSIGKKLKAFKNGTLNEQESKVIKELLCDESKEKLMNEIHFTTATVNAFAREIIGDSQYPTPHALRHMWAEAVLLRYRGDVGKFIRANFKHLDESFFMAYLRNKEVNFIMMIAKRAVINSIVREQFDAAKEGNGAYAGGFDRFIGKVAAITKVISHEDYLKKAQEIADTRIIDIKCNAFSTCMLRKGTLKAAKCSVDGVPQRYNASPKLCLHCINVNISEGNFNGIVVYTKDDVAACREPRLPYFVKQFSLSTVRSAHKRISELHEKKSNPKYKLFLTHLEDSIQMAELSRKEGDMK
ncbi:hypothetical protein H4J50_12990 [Colwellia sp. 6M3]|uniref:hypothetical protein n=1 Tax=Colwellia sp. 6M3 TaxID=2759849 RepID=UPI0015F60A01|nr:hypothetical protein [Colwellia sp. 6M3]MBA6416933.1 hypothetical protein [Colwellia sp. 6M3]